MSSPAARLGAQIARLSARAAQHVPASTAARAPVPAAVGRSVTTRALWARHGPAARLWAPQRNAVPATWRQFCAEAAAPVERIPLRKQKRAAPFPWVQVTGGVIVTGGIAYAVSEDFRNIVDEGVYGIGNMFEDFNDSSREFFESIGDRWVTKKEDPWLLELETMKYPDNIPTLVLDLDKVILHLDHDSRQGWHVIKRPFAEQFFKEISHYYEIVIFSDDVFPVALDIATKWSLPVTGVLHRDFCKKKRNKYVKDLSRLGRKMDKVLIIDHDPAAFQLQPENGLLIKTFTGDPTDSELADLLEFLKAAATSQQDIRKFVEKYGGGDEDIGRRYLLDKQDQDKRVEERRKVGRMFSSSSGMPPKGGAMGGGMAPGQRPGSRF